MESTPNASVGDNGSGIAKKKARSQIKTYVPPHMRRKTSAESSENRDNNNAAVLTTAFCPSKGVEQTEQAVDASRKGKSNTHGKKEDVSWSTFSYKASKIDKETGDDSTMPAPVIISPKAMKSSVLISGFGEMNDEAKNGILQPYVKAGGRAQWITNSEAIVVFPNETACEGAMKLVKNCFIKIEVVDNLNRHQNQQIRNACAALFESIVPERSVRVANRMIGAHLGIRMQSQPKKSAAVDESTPVRDSWDD